MLTEQNLLNIFYSSTYNLIKFYAYLNLKLVLTCSLCLKFAEHMPQHFSYRDTVARALRMELVGLKSVLRQKRTLTPLKLTPMMVTRTSLNVTFVGTLPILFENVIVC
jgi:hypothetical protein